MDKLSDRFMYYAGLLIGIGASKGIDVNIDDLKHIQNLIDLEETGRLMVIDEEEPKDNELPCNECAVGYHKTTVLGLRACEEDCVVLKGHMRSLNGE